tara:strand:+ start:330 stop:647 length:318 start_codon:yes stop_codon:yes gene_type:complete
MKNQKGGKVAKQKQQKANPRKVLEEKVNELGTLMSMCVQKINQQDTLIASVEGLIIKLSDFLGKKKDFESYLENWIKEETKKQEKMKEEEKEKLEKTTNTPSAKK